MSKLFILVLVSLVIQYSLQAEDIREKLKSAMKKCNGDLVKDSEKALDSLKPDPAVKQFYNCMGMALNLVTSAGIPQKENIYEFLCLMKVPEKAIEVLMKECAKTSSKPADTVFDMVRCARKLDKKIDM